MERYEEQQLLKDYASVAFNKETDHAVTHFNPLIPQNASMPLHINHQEVRWLDDAYEQINNNSMTIAHYGSEEQCQLYKENLERYYRERGSLFGPLLSYFERQLESAKEIFEAA